MTRPMPNGPEISVIVGAYSRERYLPLALRSLLTQTIARDRFEIVVIKNFRAPQVDRELEAAGATVLLDGEPQIGRWLRHAVRACRAPLVTFCDDDDEFEPGRLERVLETFRRYPDLGFYRNRVRVIDHEGRAVPEERWRPLERDVGLDATGPVYRNREQKGDLLDLLTARVRATFSTSTMTLRRDLLDGEFGEAFERTQLEDLFLLMVGVLSPNGLFLDDQRLTRYRSYHGNVSRGVRWLGHAVQSERDLAGIAERHGRPDFAQWLRRRSVNHERLFLGGTLVTQIGAGAGRREAARRTVEYLRFLGRHPEERAWTLDTWAAGIYGLSYLALPSVTRTVARARLRARGAS